MSVFKLENPDLSGLSDDNIFKKFENFEEIAGYFRKAFHPKYLYWDKAKYLPRPDGWTDKEFWYLIKRMRKTDRSRINSLVKHENGKFFTWEKLLTMDSLYHEMDMKLGGSITTSQFGTDYEKKKIVYNGVMEEAIASSQLEGANTTRKAAKRMLRDKIKPQDKSQQMIFNNYKTMLTIESEFKKSNLDKNLLFHLHSMITEKTIDEKEINRFRNDDDNIQVVNNRTEVIYHIPPKQDFLINEIERLIDYANDKLEDKAFVHPVTKAIIIHFWVGYLHPFTDGNGRLARALFYWYLLKNNYWVFTYLPLSRIIKKSPAQYRDAYVYSEQDDYDLTYFIDYNMRKIIQAKKEFEEYCKRKESENLQMKQLAISENQFNMRQLQLLRYLYKNKKEITTYNTHANINQVTRLTARKDLKTLEKLGFLKSTKIGREVTFFGTDKVKEIFEKK